MRLNFRLPPVFVALAAVRRTARYAVLNLRTYMVRRYLLRMACALALLLLLRSTLGFAVSMWRGRDVSEIRFERSLPLEQFRVEFADRGEEYAMMPGNESECGGKTIAVYVMSTTHPHARLVRDALRRTVFRGEERVIHKFFIGFDHLMNIEGLREEMREFGDIVYYDGRGDYRSNYVKWYGMYKWHERHCAQARFFVKMDDDTVVDFARLLQWIDRDFYWHTTGRDNYIVCNAFMSYMPLRVKGDKWYVSPTEYPNQFWPTYCYGFVLVMPTATVSQLLEACKRLTFFPMDDVLLTGMAAEAARVPIFDFVGFRTDAYEDVCTRDGLPYPVSTHNAKTPKAIESDFNRLRSLKCNTLFETFEKEIPVSEMLGEE